MQLHVARLCLDCEEVHVERACPRCSSESFALLSKWVPAPERRAQPRPPGRDEDPEIYRQLLKAGTDEAARSRRWLQGGVLLAALSAGGWLWQRNAKRTQATTPPAPPQR
jgi:hypothetical protein